MMEHTNVGSVKSGSFFNASDTIMQEIETTATNSKTK